MPYDGDPKRFTQTTDDVFSLASLARWLEKQDPTATYVWFTGPGDCRGGCLIHQYLTAHGKHPINDYESLAGCLPDPILGPECRSYVDRKVAMARPHTFGAALDRCLTLMSTGKREGV